MSIFQATIGYSVILVFFSIVSWMSEGGNALWLTLPFVGALIGYSLVAIIQDTPEVHRSCLRTLMILAVLLILATSGRLVEFIYALTNPENAITPAIAAEAIMFALSALYFVMTVIALSHLRSPKSRAKKSF